MISTINAFELNSSSHEVLQIRFLLYTKASTHFAWIPVESSERARRPRACWSPFSLSTYTYTKQSARHSISARCKHPGVQLSCLFSPSALVPVCLGLGISDVRYSGSRASIAMNECAHLIIDGGRENSEIDR